MLEDYDADHAKNSLPGGAPDDIKRPLVKSKESRVLAAGGSGESKLHKRKARNSDTDFDAVSNIVIESKPHKKLMTSGRQEIREPWAACNALVKHEFILDTENSHSQVVKEAKSIQADIEPSSPRLFLPDGRSIFESENATLAVARNKYKLTNSYYETVTSPHTNQWIGAMA